MWLSKHLGLVEAERFIMLIQREPFDYTKWQENLFEDIWSKCIKDHTEITLEKIFDYGIICFGGFIWQT
jgi:hypothetical protein